MIVRLATFASPPPDVRAEALRNLTERFQPALVAQPETLTVVASV
jgi:hypothetical protein